MTTLPQPMALTLKQRSLTVGLARTPEDVRAGQRLRFDVFAREMGATLHNHTPDLDDDDLDPFCQHLLVREAFSGHVVGYTRLLTDRGAHGAGGFYSAAEFDLSRLLANAPGRYVEIGRTCIHPEYRNGATIATLWSGLATFVADEAIDYLIGCASIPLALGLDWVRELCCHLQAQHATPEALRVFPKVPLPATAPEPTAPPTALERRLPPLLKAYLRVGARIGGEPCFDPDFNVADVLIFLPTERIERRYARHFIDRVVPDGVEPNSIDL